MANKNKNGYTDIWNEYRQGIEYNQNISYYRNSKINERFLSGDQWYGVDSKGLPTPQFNIFKRVFAFIRAYLKTSAIAVKFTAEGVDLSKSKEDMSNEEQLIAKTLEVLHKKINQHMEDCKMDQIISEVLNDAVITGDFASFTMWDPNIKNGKVKGDFVTKRIYGAKVLFGNPNTREVNGRGIPTQPYILLEGRDTVRNLRMELEQDWKENKRGPKEDLELKKKRIQPDSVPAETQSSDRALVELKTTSDNAKATYIIKLEYDLETKTIKQSKSTRDCDIYKDKDTGLTQYPVAWENWETRNDSYHGQSPMTGYIPNQVFINKALAIVMIGMMNNASPKVAYDNTRINGIANTVSGSISVSGPVNDAIKVINSGQLPNSIVDLIQMVAKITIEALGGNEVVLGNVAPENKSAIVQVTQQASIPYENQKGALYNFMEQNAYIWIDFLKNKYGKIPVELTLTDDDGNQYTETLDLKPILDKEIKVKVDIGPSSYFSELDDKAILDNLLTAGLIDVIDYLERLPEGKIPKKRELINSLKSKITGEGDAERDAEFEKVALFIEQLPVEFQEEFERIMVME